MSLSFYSVSMSEALFCFFVAPVFIFLLVVNFTNDHIEYRSYSHWVIFLHSLECAPIPLRALIWGYWNSLWGRECTSQSLWMGQCLRIPPSHPIALIIILPPLPRCSLSLGRSPGFNTQHCINWHGSTFLESQHLEGRGRKIRNSSSSLAT